MEHSSRRVQNNVEERLALYSKRFPRLYRKAADIFVEDFEKFLDNEERKRLMEEMDQAIKDAERRAW